MLTKGANVRKASTGSCVDTGVIRILLNAAIRPRLIRALAVDAHEIWLEESR